MEWLSRNVGAVITFIVVSFGAIGAWFLGGADIKQLKRDREKAGERSDRQDDRIHELEAIVNAHISDSLRHIDPNRDKKIWEGFQDAVFQRFDAQGQRFDTLERKIERVMIHTPPS